MRIADHRLGIYLSVGDAGPWVFITVLLLRIAGTGAPTTARGNGDKVAGPIIIEHGMN